MDIISRIVELMQNQQTHCLATIVESSDPAISIGQKVIVLKDGSMEGEFSSSRMNAAIGDLALEAIDENEKRMVEIVSGVRIFLDVLSNETRLIVCGAGHIAIPLARVAGISIAGKKGLLVRDFSAFEQAERVTAFVFDKTGTITAGKWNLLDIICDESLTSDQALALAAGLEKDSEHFIAIEIVNQAGARNVQPTSLTDIQIDDKGVQGKFNGQTIKIGSAEFLEKELKGNNNLGALAVLDATANHSLVYLGIDGQLAAIFVFGDTVRQDALKTVQRLNSIGLRLALVSGDGEQTTRAIGDKIGTIVIKRFIVNTFYFKRTAKL